MESFLMIPKIIHYCWFGNAEKPVSVLKCIESWKKYCPDYEIIEWNESNYDVTKNRYMREAYEEKRWGFVSDYARLDIIYNYGGIYLDTDVELIKSLDNLLIYDSYFGFEQSDNAFLVNTGSGFGAVKNNPFVQGLRDSYNELSFRLEDGTLLLTPCPIINTEYFMCYGFNCDNTYQCLSNNAVFPTDFFSPLSWKNKKGKTTENTISIHHYTTSWLTNKEKFKRKMHKFTHLPNFILLKIFGNETYEVLKKRIKRG